MALYDAPTHRVAIHSVTSSTDSGGGTTLTYSAKQSSIPCVVNTTSAAEQLRYAQQQIVVTHTVSFLASTITTSLVRGDKIVDAFNSASYHVRGIRTTQAYGNVPSFIYADCEQLLG